MPGIWARTLSALGIKQAPSRRSAAFAGAQMHRLTASWASSSQSVNADLDAALVVMRARARSLCQNNEFARRFLTLVANNVVGHAGPTLQVRSKNPDGSLDKVANDTIETHWARWGQVADITGRMTFAEMQHVGIKAVARDGEALIRKIKHPSQPYGLRLQLLDADRLGEQINRRLDGGGYIRQGVEHDAYGAPVAYFISTSHPGDSYIASGGVQYERVPADQIFHLIRPERAEQVRGYTWLHAVLMRMNMLHGFEEAAVVAARVGASKMAVLTRSEDSADAMEQMADAKTSTGALQMSAEPGEIFELPPGYGIASWDPDYPHANFESFLKACLRGLATGLDVATHNLSGDMTDVNYSSARIAELSERDQWTVLQGWWIAHFVMPLYREWLELALLGRKITFDGSGKPLPYDKFDKFANASRFQPRTWAWVDPLKEAQAAKELIGAALVSRTQIAASQGREFEEIVDELAQEEALMDAAGLAPAAETSPTPPDDDPEDGDTAPKKGKK